MNYLIAYDICHPRRLRRVARLLEKHAVRCQKSVFMFRGSTEKLQSIMEQIARLIEEQEDLVQAWRLAPRETADGISVGEPAVLFPDAVVIDSGNVYSVRDENAK